MLDLNRNDQEIFAEILNRRAKEIAGFADEYRRDPKHYGSVELALSREINRLLELAEKVCPKIENEGGEHAD